MERAAKQPLRTVLLVEDDVTTRTPIALFLADEGYKVYEAESAEEGLAIVEANRPSAIISDIRLKAMTGIDLLRRVKAWDPEIPVILMTAHGSIEDAVSAMSLGAETYLTKPVRIDDLANRLDRVFEKVYLQEEVRRLKKELASQRRLGRLVGGAPPMRQVFELIQQVATSNATVLIYGESGTGKELVAEAVHQLSTRSDLPFIKLNCAVFTETLLESELFGHEKGAFTGAYGQRKGRFEQAHRGTLFLDDISVMPETIQIKLLRFLQEREFERVGGNQTIKVDVRVIAATNEPLEKVVESGRFRQDLFYRLNVIPISIPPLRERKADLPLLVVHFIEKHSVELNRPNVKGIAPDALEKLTDYDWPGNVRELENWVQRAVVMCPSDIISRKHMPTLGVFSIPKKPGLTDNPNGAGINGSGDALKDKAENYNIVGKALKDIERDSIIATLQQCKGSTAKASRILGISARKIQYKLKEYKDLGYHIPANLLKE